MIASTAVYYKIKMNKLEQIYQQSRSTAVREAVVFSGKSGGRILLPHDRRMRDDFVQVQNRGIFSAFFRLVFQLLNYVLTSFLIGAWQPSGINY